jgi:hypothetical protein
MEKVVLAGIGADATAFTIPDVINRRMGVHDRRPLAHQRGAGASGLDGAGTAVPPSAPEGGWVRE